jgi:hypothetical protein
MPWIGFLDNHSPPSPVGRTAGGVCVSCAARGAVPARPLGVGRA